MHVKMFLYVFLISSYFSLLLSGCNKTTSFPYENEHMGISLEYPQEMKKRYRGEEEIKFVLTDVGSIMVSTHDRHLPEFDHPMINEIDEDNVIEMIEFYNNVFLVSPTAFIIEAPERIVVNGTSGAMTTIEYQRHPGETQVLLSAIIMYDEQTIMINGFAPEGDIEQLRPMFQDVVYSIKPLE